MKAYLVQKTLCDKWFPKILAFKTVAEKHRKRHAVFGQCIDGVVDNKMNHEIDIEIPANCMGTAVCRPTAEECSPSHGLTAMCNTTA